VDGARQLLWVGLGGFLGAASRYLLAGWVHQVVPLTTFPLGTLVVNVAGCLGIGALAGLAEFRQVLGPELRAFAMIGVLGGFTTFSTFAHETLALARDSELLRAFANVALQVVAGLAAAWLGYALARG
jgi:CrcB protein